MYTGKTPTFDNVLKALVAVFVTLCCFVTNANSVEKTLTIKGYADDVGTTLTFDDSSTLSIESTATGLILTLPDIDMRIRCQGTVTDQDYCYLGAKGSAASLEDVDEDGVIDEWDKCIPSSVGAYTNRQGCEDKDGDGVPDNIDECPSESAGTASGCLATYVVTPSAGANGTISPSSPQTVKEGSRVVFTLTPSDGYQVASVGGSCGGLLSLDDTKYTTAEIGKDCDVAATFELVTDTLTDAYCKDAPTSVAARISCSPLLNMDTWWENEASFKEMAIPARKIKSLPFATRDSTTDKGQVQITANMPTLDSSKWSWHGWISEVPGGTAVSRWCESYAEKAQTEIAWTQIPEQAAWQICYLGGEEKVYHLNFEVRCVAELGMTCGTGDDLYWPLTYWMEIFARP